MPLTFKNESATSLDIEVYDAIGFWGTSAKAFSERIKAAKGKAINLKINSPGGSVVEGNAIYNILRDHEGEVTAYITGLAASMASVIAMAAKKVVMAQNALLMIHNPSVGMEGDAEDHRQAAEILDKMKAGIVNAYVKKTGKHKATIEKWMDEETWFTAQEAVDAGFADSVKKDKDAKNEVDLLAFAAYYPHKLSASASAKAGKPTNKNNMTPEEIQALENKVKTAEAEKAAAEKTLADAQAKAAKEATDAKNAEKARKDAILAIRDKYNKDGDLNDSAVKALAGDVTPEQYKDQVLEVISKRGTKEAIKPAVASTDKKDVAPVAGELTFEQFKDAYTKEEDSGKRQALFQKHKAFAKRLLAEESAE